MSSDIRLSTIGQIALIVSDMDRALSFYRDVLGLTHLFSAGPELAFLDADGVRLMLTTPHDGDTEGGNSILYFKVADIEPAYAALTARGAAGERAPQLTAKLPDHELWIAFLRDPDDNLIGLMEERQPR